MCVFKKTNTKDPKVSELQFPETEPRKPGLERKDRFIYCNNRPIIVSVKVSVQRMKERRSL